MILCHGTCNRCTPKFLFQGKEIEIIDESQESQLLPPDVVKMKWRKEQIRAREEMFLLDKSRRKQFLQSLFLWKSQGNNVDGRKRSGGPPCSTMQNTLDSVSEWQCLSSYGHSSSFSCAVWSGWIRFKDGDGSTLLATWRRRWKTRWCILSIEGGHLRLDMLVQEATSGMMTMKKSVVLDSSSAAALDKPILQCTGCMRLSIRVPGCRRRHRLECESAEETQRLLACMHGLLGSAVTESFGGPSQLDHCIN